MNRSRYLFVYGSLKRGSQVQEAKMLALCANWIGPAQVRGRLFAHAGYPMLATGSPASAVGRGTVHGELFRLRDTARMLTWLDHYELCGPHDRRPHPYRRTLIAVATPEGERRALAYVANLPISRLRRWTPAV